MNTWKQIKKKEENKIYSYQCLSKKRKEKKEEQKIEMKQITRDGLDKYVSREKQPIMHERDYNVTAHVPEQLQSN